MMRLAVAAAIPLLSLLSAIAPEDGAPPIDPGGAAAPAPGGAATGGGACCLPDGCEQVDDAPTCAGLGGVYLPGEDCANDACGVGACCAGMGCVEIDAYSCISGGREFAGAGTRCADDPCDIGVGACCFGEACEIVPEDDCTDGGGVFLGIGTNCAVEPCVEGACCVGEECSDGTRQDCFDLDGAFFAGVACVESPCIFLPCPPDTLFSQTPDTPEDFTAGTSENASPFLRYENFSGVAGAIERLTWWGLDLRPIGGNQWEECEETDNTFEVGFYRDAGGAPGEMVCFDKVFATRTPLGIFYLGAELNEYHAEIFTPCALTEGWISIQGFGNPTCWFLWMSAGIGTSWCDGCRPEEQSLELSICLQGTVGGVFGACCDDDTGLCFEDVEIDDCAEPGLRFEPDASCGDLDPPCGVILGACCFENATCSLELQNDCIAAGGSWLGARTQCDQCPCAVPCPEDATREGEPRCFDGYVDRFNGGCNAAEPAFSPIALGETVCGETGVFDDGQSGDFDSYQVEVEKPVLLSWTVAGEFPVRATIVDGREGCPGAILNTDTRFACDELTITAPAQPGNYWLVVVPAAFSDESACGAEYVATLGPDPCPPDFDGSGAVDFADLLALLAAWGPCGGCPEDLDGNGAVDFSDLLELLAAWGPCA